MKHEEIAKSTGKSRSYITNLLRILNLDKYFLSLLNKGIITMGHARALIGKTPDNFDEKMWTELYRLSEDSFVDETDQLKEKGAGAGLTDND